MVFWRWFCNYYFQTDYFQSGTIVTNKEVPKTTKEDKYPLKYLLSSPLSTPPSGITLQWKDDSYMTMRDIADVCDIKDLKFFRESYITPVLKEGLIERLYFTLTNRSI